jgi:hypothetical protein
MPETVSQLDVNGSRTQYFCELDKRLTVRNAKQRCNVSNFEPDYLQSELYLRTPIRYKDLAINFPECCEKRNEKIQGNKQLLCFYSK